MKPKVYRSKYIFLETCDLIEKNNYIQMGETKKNSNMEIEISLFFEKHTKKNPDWLKEISELFELESLVENLEPIQYNAIIIVKTEKTVYLLPKGQAFRIVEQLSFSEFGLDFAEKAVPAKNIRLKGVSYIQRNKMRGLTNYKQNQTEFPQASESYFSISGQPLNENIFGLSVDCGSAITFSKNFNFEDSNQVNSFYQLFNEIDTALNLSEKISTIPRLIKVSQKDELNKVLNQNLLKDLEGVNSEGNLMIDISRIQLIGNSINILENDRTFSIYILNQKKLTTERIALDTRSISEYIIKNKSLISNIDQIMFSIYDMEDTFLSSVTFLNLIYYELEYEGKVYVLDNGKWGYFNNRFYELLESKMNEINSVVRFMPEYSIEYDSYNKGELAGEGGYIEKLSQNSNMIKLHKRNITVSGNTIELADIYNDDKDELLAIKRGTDTSLAMYSFEQSLLSMQVLANKLEFNVKNELLKYNDRNDYMDEGKYPTINEPIVDKITECKRNSVLWLIDEKPIYVYEGVINKTFHISKFKSLMLKLKIIDWYLFTKDNGYIPGLYFAIDKSTDLIVDDLNP